MNNVTRLWIAVVVVGLGTLVAGTSAAQRNRPRVPPPPQQPAPPAQSPMPTPPVDAATQRAHEAYDRGRGLFQTGQWREALASFREAYDAKPHPTVLLSIAECQDRMGDVRGAVATFEQYLTTAPDARDREGVTAKIVALRQRPAIVHVTSEPTGARIDVDARSTDLRTPADVELAPGEHVLSLTLEGHVERTDRLTVDYAERRDAAYSLEREARRAETTVPATPRTPRRSGSRAAMWFGASVTGVSLATGAVLGVLALTTRADFDDAPSVRLADRGDRFALAADIAFGVALAAGMATLFAWAGSPSAEEVEPSDVTVAPILHRAGAGVRARVDF